jgi:uncharacterized membrane protein
MLSRRKQEEKLAGSIGALGLLIGLVFVAGIGELVIALIIASFIMVFIGTAAQAFGALLQMAGESDETDTV